MHQLLYEDLRVNTFLLKFYGFLSRGFYPNEVRQSIEDLINRNIESLNIMNLTKWDGTYDLVRTQLLETKQFVTSAKANSKYYQICQDIDITNYLISNHNFYQDGILLNDLRKLLNIDVLFKNGYMLHDSFLGYPEKDLFCFSISCMDYLYSAAHFYNEAYDYYHNKKDVEMVSKENFHKIGLFELRRIQPKEEIMYRNFRETFINLIFFIESFINSVGYDAYLSGIAQTTEHENQLRGMNVSKKGYLNYSNLTEKIKNIARIIGSSEIETEIEPFKTYLMHDVELRNQYVHSSPNKDPIKLNYEDWKVKCDTLITKSGYDFLNGFWRKCYPGKVFPKVVFNEYWNSFKGIQGRAMVMDN